MRPTCLYLHMDTIISTAASKCETELARQERIKWWREARFGMFIHWGLYARPRKRGRGNPLISDSRPRGIQGDMR